ncbi:unnamed protein product [Gongylonema pulchrum]|uniref:Uncharacterized protein n=1 Tax=Gongylonema pulchrum TaxID=637853 RepID=A0A183DKA8_9BILA|nr:unnamed protein product [Gongylonema pulchrum]
MCPFDQSKMFALLERKKHTKILSIYLPTREDYLLAGVTAPPSRDTTSRSTTPLGSSTTAISSLTGATATSTDLSSTASPLIHCTATTTGVLEPSAITQAAPSVASSHLSAVSEEDNDEQGMVNILLESPKQSHHDVSIVVHQCV